MTLTSDQSDCIQRYLQTGEVDLLYCPWPGGLVSGGAEQAKALRAALVNEVKRRTRRKRLPAMPEMDLVLLTRKKVEPMVSGLFSKAERARVLQVLEKSVVFLTPLTFESVLTKMQYDSTAWTLANLVGL